MNQSVHSVLSQGLGAHKEAGPSGGYDCKIVDRDPISNNTGASDKAAEYDDSTALSISSLTIFVGFIITLTVTVASVVCAVAILKQMLGGGLYVVYGVLCLILIIATAVLSSYSCSLHEKWLAELAIMTLAYAAVIHFANSIATSAATVVLAYTIVQTTRAICNHNLKHHTGITAKSTK